MTFDRLRISEPAPIEIQELAIALYAQTLDPKLAQLDFLKFSGIIPKDWELKNSPIFQENLTQLVFTNGVTLTAQPRTINFTEAIAPQPSPLQVPDLARRYTQALPHVDYQALSIAPKILVLASDRNATAQKLILDTLLAPGSWRELGSGPIRASVNLVYQLENRQFQLAIDEVRVQQADGTLMPALLFSGSFNCQISGETAETKQNEIQQVLDNVPTDLETFRHLVRQQFLGTSERIFPPEVL
ncbi:MAG: hypothetical protein SVX43_12890 [Cyanobacteriota bacterium]|nr:hypothetical protein [Cyanobacteriota bacterium]